MSIRSAFFVSVFVAVGLLVGCGDSQDPQVHGQDNAYDLLDKFMTSLDTRDERGFMQCFDGTSDEQRVARALYNLLTAADDFNLALARAYGLEVGDRSASRQAQLFNAVGLSLSGGENQGINMNFVEKDSRWYIAIGRLRRTERPDELANFLNGMARGFSQTTAEIDPETLTREDVRSALARRIFAAAQ